MRIAHVFDDLSRLAPAPTDPLDLGAEWEDERTVAAQAEALRRGGHEVIPLPFGPDLDLRLREIAPDCVFNIAEGRRGPDRESVVPALCLHLGIPCTSSGATAMGLSLDKNLCKHAARSLGVLTPDWVLVRGASDLNAPFPDFPLFVKPNGEGSSMGIRPDSVVRSPEALANQARWVLERIGPALVERFLPGRELTVGLLGNPPDLTALPFAEIRTHGRVYDKGMKSKDRLEEEILCPADLSPDRAGTLVRDSVRLFAELGLSGLARFDFKEDEAGRPHFMEVNPLPGLSPYYSVFTIQARSGGVTYDQLINLLVTQAVQRNALRTLP